MKAENEATSAEVEALAQVLGDACCEGFCESHGTCLRRLAARAIAHLRQSAPNCHECAEWKEVAENLQQECCTHTHRIAAARAALKGEYA